MSNVRAVHAVMLGDESPPTQHLPFPSLAEPLTRAITKDGYVPPDYHGRPLFSLFAQTGEHRRFTVAIIGDGVRNRIGDSKWIRKALSMDGSNGVFFERRSNVSDILASDSGCTRFATRCPHESCHAPAHATYDGLAAHLTVEEVRRWRK